MVLVFGVPVHECRRVPGDAIPVLKLHGGACRGQKEAVLVGYT